jgi:hypothetical protein
LFLHVVWMWNVTKILSISFFLQKKSSTKCEIKKIMIRLMKNITRPLQLQHKKQRKTKKWPKDQNK